MWGEAVPHVFIVYFPLDWTAMEAIRTPKVENVRMLDRFNNRKSSTGSLYLTTTHLIFFDPDRKKETWILHMHIASIAKLPISANGTPLQIRCKNFLCVTFLIPKERDCHDIFISLQQLSQPLHINDLYCFHYTASNEDLTKAMGWSKFDFQAEYVRMGVPNTYWSATNINQEYEICDTYPRHLYVPSVASTAILVGSSQFRSKGRLPVLSYLNKNMAAICRCSQPLSGFSARCVEDEQLLNCILKSNPSSKFMYVVDTRPRINAMANKAAGKGYENENFYENIKFQFFGIENIHVMRNSLQKLIDTCEASEPSMGGLSGRTGGKRVAATRPSHSGDRALCGPSSGRRRERVGALLGWLGPHSADMLPGKPPAGSLLSHHHGFSGFD
ncbi:hypothetical protein MRX96_041345 [Rhipicephalus microplus]